MKKVLVLLLVILGVNASVAQTPSSVTEWSIKRQGVKLPDDVLQLSPADGTVSVTYKDGFGNKTQTIVKRGSPQLKDVVSFSVYDDKGREPRQYLPYVANTNNGSFQPDAPASQALFFNNLYGGAGYAYEETGFEQNGLARVNKRSDAGANQVGSERGREMLYDFNTNAEEVHIWHIGNGENNLPYTGASEWFGDGVLSKEVVKDEKGVKTITYADYRGRILLQKVQLESGTALTNTHAGWLCTYFVYDDFDQLRYIVSPKAVAWLQGNNWAMTTGVADELCDKYYYNGYGDIVAQRMAGGGLVETVYDRKRRPVFVRSALDKARGRWKVTFSDEQDRPVIKGFMVSALERTVLAEQVAAKEVTPVAMSAGATDNSGALERLRIALREQGRLKYIAGEEITIEAGFESELNAEFEAFIEKTIPAGTGQQVMVAGNFMPSNTQLTTLEVHYYDDYSYSGAKAFSSSYRFAATNDLNVMPVTKTLRTLNKQTGVQYRIIDDEDYTTDGFITATTYYDERDRETQQLADNYLKGMDVTTLQYNYAGLCLGVSVNRNVPGTSVRDFYEGSAYVYDDGGRIVSVAKSYNTNTWKRVVAYSYNALGQLSQQVLSPDYNSNAGIETRDLTYNVSGTLTGINKNYVTDQSVSSQWSRAFGEIIGYDNGENGIFSAARYDGIIAGNAWKSQGDNKPRRYNYEYTNAGALSKALFTQKENPGSGIWAADKTDASMPKATYDGNGNITALQHRGNLPGKGAPVLIDNLTYQYDKQENSNRLTAVTDAVTGNANGSVGDFVNGTGVPAVQYTYDDAGNLINDWNKNIRAAGEDGIRYNILNRPWKVTRQEKATLQYVYDAAGNLLARKVTNTAVSPNTVVWKYYLDDLVIQDNVPVYFRNEAGRLRISQAASSAADAMPALTIGGNEELLIDGKAAFYDFYVTDHLGSTRAILTEETHVEDHMATMELSNTTRQAYEERVFGQVTAAGEPAAANEVKNTRRDMPVAWGSHYNDAGNKKASMLNKNTPVGPNMLLKVMAGDELNVRTDYFYNETPTGTDNGLPQIVQSLIGAFSTSAPAIEAGAKDAVAQLQAQLLNSGDLLAYANNPDNNIAGSAAPKAYLNWLFLDENFQPVPYDATSGMGSGAQRVTAAGDGQAPLVRAGIKVPANGYVFVYVSNTSTTNVWFDNFTVRHTRGRLLEEQHYYPYGLQIAAISSKAYGKLDNRFGFQGLYSEYEPETGWNNFQLRDYDAQLGRWMAVDPYAQYASGYTGMGNNPGGLVDKDGGMTHAGGGAGSVVGLVVGAAMPYVIEEVFNVNIQYKGLWVAAGAFLGAGVGYALGETWFPEASYSAGFGDNLAAFYKGVFGANEDDQVNFGSLFKSTNGGGRAAVPDVWGWVGNVTGGISDIFAWLKTIKLPSIPVKEIVTPKNFLLEIYFKKSTSDLDDKKNNSKKLDRQIRKLDRILTGNKTVTVFIKGGLKKADDGSDIEAPEGTPEGGDYYYKYRSATELAEDRAIKARKLVQQRLIVLYADRIKIEGGYETGDWRASGKLKY
ncbi:RHS repeat-associated protein [Filimonas zeae]|nr:DUF6443 domain-containing protein [Filimonas zeae]MDR6339018.1 RHS repeat-associated protein [Filimonas zeae]